MRFFLTVIAGLSFALYSFAGYEIKTQGDNTTIKRDGQIIKTVVNYAFDNNEYIKIIDSLIKIFEKTEEHMYSTVRYLRDMGHTDADIYNTEKKGHEETEKIELAISSIIPLLKQ